MVQRGFGSCLVPFGERKPRHVLPGRLGGVAGARVVQQCHGGMWRHTSPCPDIVSLKAH